MTEINEEGFRRAQKRLKIAMIVIPIITMIAIVLVVRWALSSPTLETLVTVNTGVGVATLGALFQAIALVSSRLQEATSSVRDDMKGFGGGIRDMRADMKGLREDMRGVRGDVRSMREEIRSNTDRLIEAVERTRK